MAGQRGEQTTPNLRRNRYDGTIRLNSLQIAYTSIVGVVMIAAFLEWFLWIAAFLYCLWKVFVKAEHWTVRVLAVFVGVAFTLLRY